MAGAVRAGADRDARLWVGLLVLGLVLGFSISFGATLSARTDVVVLISADAEWKPVRALLAKETAERTPFGEFIAKTLDARGRTRAVIYFHGGWGKISAAASTQYAIDRWAPRLLVNIGTCGGFEGSVRIDDLLLVTRTVVYDIVEMMGDADEAIADYTTALDLAWLKKPYPERVIEGPLVSADRDIQPADIPKLRTRYGGRRGRLGNGRHRLYGQAQPRPLPDLAGGQRSRRRLRRRRLREGRPL